MHINQVLLKSCILPLKFPRFREDQLPALPSINCPLVTLDENVVASNGEMLLIDNSITRFLFRAKISLSRPGHGLAWSLLCSSSVQGNPPASAWEGLQVCSTIPTSSARFHARMNHWNPKSVSAQQNLILRKCHQGNRDSSADKVLDFQDLSSIPRTHTEGQTE